MIQANLQPIDKVLERLDKVKSKGADKWQALCPAHNDKTPSLTITQCKDGTVLVKCWCGCTAKEIVTAINLQLKDLFPYNPKFKPIKKLPSKEAVNLEKNIVAIVANSKSKGVSLNKEESDRYQLAVKRLELVNKITGGKHE